MDDPGAPGDAQREYDTDPALRELLGRAAGAPTVERARTRAGAAEETGEAADGPATARQLVELLRHFAERAAACWEGNDADDAITVMAAAAEVLEGHADTGLPAGRFDELAQREPLDPGRTQEQLLPDDTATDLLDGGTVTGALYPDDFPEEPVAGVTDDEVEDFLASIGKAGEPESERARLSAVLRNELADYKAQFFDDPYDHFATGYVAGLERAADLLDGDR